MSSEKPSGCPYQFEWDATEPKVPKKNDLTYNNYLKVNELLSLQLPQSKPAHHDELLFIVIHQAYELWFKLILHEMEQSIFYMKKNNPLKARHFLNRVTKIQEVLVHQIHILETMTPVDFLEFRDRLTPASGFQSSQFREVEFLAGLRDDRYLSYFKKDPVFLKKLQKRMQAESLKSAFYDLLKNLGFKIPKNAFELESKDYEKFKKEMMKVVLPIYQEPEKHMPLYLLAESLMDFDQNLSLWRDHHVRVVERIIGFKEGTGGSTGVDYLRRTTIRRCFPLFWELRTELKKN